MTALSVVVLTKGPGDEALDGSIEAIAEREHEHVEEHVAESDSGQVVTRNVAHEVDVEQLHGLEED